MTARFSAALLIMTVLHSALWAGVGKNEARYMGGAFTEVKPGAEGSVKLFQDVRVFVARLEAGCEAQAELAPGRCGFLQVARGSLSLNGQTLQAGDSARVEAEPRLTLHAETASEVLLFDLA
jgi:redox-sensitive bicupin YhaK (pirin superfamily)